MSETLTMLIVDGLTGETIERELTTEEIADREAIQTRDESHQADQAAARQSALAKLADLGLTAEEIAAL